MRKLSDLAVVVARQAEESAVRGEARHAAVDAAIERLEGEVAALRAEVAGLAARIDGLPKGLTK